jgi:hypothetical protein
MVNGGDDFVRILDPGVAEKAVEGIFEFLERSDHSSSNVDGAFPGSPGRTSTRRHLDKPGPIAIASRSDDFDDSDVSPTGNRLFVVLAYVPKAFQILR